MRDARALIFDADWYRHAYADVRAAGIDPWRHYTAFGAAELRCPQLWFDPRWYLARYPDVDATATDPARHYMERGAAEGRAPHPGFDPAWYATQVETDNPLVHWTTAGAALGLSPTPPLARAFLPSAAPLPMAPPGLGVDIVVTVHDAAEATRRCLASVLNDPARPPGRVIVVDDASTDAALRAWLDGLAAQGRILLTRHGGVRGFTASANNGMALRAPGRDVVLLNSDTQVPVGWLDRLAGHAHASPWIGTVTPFSNNATICSYPAVLGASLPFDRTLAEVDAACRTANAGRRVDLPTAVGFCMYIRRDCLAATGPFDEATFGAGYGEENDFCLRAARLGWRHALACDTFVYHRGGASFGTAARALYTANNRILAARYRHYNRIVDDHVKQDAALPFRFAVTALLFRAAGPTLLGLGGTGTYGRNTLRMDETADALTLAVPFHAAHPVARLPTDQPEQVAAILRGFGVAAIRHADWTPPGPASRAVAAALGLEIGAGVAGYLGATVTPAGVMPLGGEPFSAGSAASPS